MPDTEDRLRERAAELERTMARGENMFAVQLFGGGSQWFKVRDQHNIDQVPVFIGLINGQGAAARPEHDQVMNDAISTAPISKVRRSDRAQRRHSSRLAGG